MCTQRQRRPGRTPAARPCWRDAALCYRGQGHAPGAAAAATAAAAFVAAAPSLIAVAFVAFFALAFFSAFAFLAAATATAASVSVASVAVAITPRLRRRFLAILALLGRVDDLSFLGLEALGLALELPVLLVRLLLGGGGGGGGHGGGGGGDGAGDGPQMSPIGPRRGLRLLGAGLSGPGVLRGALQEPVTEKGARAEGTFPFISQPASSLSLRQLRGSQPRGKRESKDGARPWLPVFPPP